MNKRLLRYNLESIVFFTLLSVIVLSGIVCIIIYISSTSSWRSTGSQFRLNPRDLGTGWAYKLMIESVYIPSQAGGTVALQSIYHLYQSIDIDDNTKLIKNIIQVVRIYPDIDTAIDDEELNGWQTLLEHLALPFWDEVYLGTGSDMKYAVRLTLRKTNQIIFLSYCDEEIWKRDPLTGEFDRMEYLELNQEEMQWADNFLCDLAEVIKEKMVTNIL